MGRKVQNNPPLLRQKTIPALPDLDLLTQRLHLLAEPQRSLLKMYWLKNCSVRLIAQVQKVHTQTARRQIHEWTERLLSEDYIAFCRHRQLFSDEQMTVAYRRFILGEGCPRIAHHIDKSRSCTRQIVKQLEFWLSKYKEDPTHLKL